MIKQSVKKPFTVLVAVIMVLVLGFVSVTNMTMDLLPPISLPYLIVITTYPGASAEKVATEVTVPMENALGTITGVSNVFSTSAENYGMVQLEFEDGTDMDSAMVKVSSAVNQAAASLPELCGVPSIMEMSMDMLPTMYVAVSREGYDIYALSDLVEADVMPYIQRQNGVASVSTIGVVEKSVQVELDRGKIETLNNRLLAQVDEKLAEALKGMEEAEKQVSDGKAELEKQQATFGETMSSQIFGAVEGEVLKMAEDLRGQVEQLLPLLEELQQAVGDAEINGRIQELIDTLKELQGMLKSTEKDSKDMARTLTRLENAIEDLIYEIGYLGDALERLENATNIKRIITEILRVVVDFRENDEDEWIVKLGDAAERLELLCFSSLYDLYSSVRNLSGIMEDQRLQKALDKVADELFDIIEDLTDTMEDVSDALEEVDLTELRDALTELQTVLEEVYESDPTGQAQAAIDEVYTALLEVMELLAQAPDLLDMLEEMFAQLTQGQLDAAVGFSTALVQLMSAEQQLTEARTQFDAAKETALKSANLDTLLSLDTLSQLIYAHNFAMPAGYIDDAQDNSWLLKVGDELDSVEALSRTMLVSMDGIGDVRLCDVAEVTVIDNADESYAKVNGEESVMLSIFKSSTVGTNTVSKNCQTAFDELESDYGGMRVDVLMNQGDYIDLIVSSVLSSMVLGAALAVLVLALFLKDVKPTLVVAISIPLSVLFAIVLMYFTGLTLNMITLSGLALGIGMLVDNSVVVLENIYRLRGRGVSAPRAAVQGTLQVSGSIIASTLTTVCVFLPMVFATGTVKELLVPMGLSIAYCLMASLVVAETVVPASCSTLLRNAKPKAHPWFDKILRYYEKLLNWCLDHRLATIAVAMALLAMTVWQVFRTGLVMLPEMTAEQITVSITTNEEMDRRTSYQTADEVMNRILELEGVSMVGIMDSGSSGGMMSMSAGGGSYGSYTGYVMAGESLGSSGVKALCEAINASAEGLDCTVSASANGMGDMGALMSGGLSVSIYGDNLEGIVRVSEDVMELVESVDGFENARNGLEDLPASRHLAIDRDAAARAGLTTAQIYMEVAGQLTSSAVATTITAGGDTMQVTISDTTDLPTLEELLDLEITGNSMGEDGKMVETVYRLGEFAVIEEAPAVGSITRENQNTYMTVSADTAEGLNTTLLSRTLQEKLDAYERSGKLPKGVSVVMSGESSQVNEMIWEMCKMMALALVFVYLVMVAQFQSLLSPFIVLFTVPLAFTGGMLGLMVADEQLSLLAMMGFLVLMGTVVNNGIVFVDYTNQLRMGGMTRRDALVATGKTRMRPILMTTLTTVLAMGQMIFGDDMGSQLGGGMSIVIAGGLTYATLMTLLIIPVMYDILFRRPPMNVDLGSEDLDDVPDDAAEFLAQKALEDAAADE